MRSPQEVAAELPSILDVHFCVLFFVVVFVFCCFLFYQNFKINTPWRSGQVGAKPVREKERHTFILNNAI